MTASPSGAIRVLIVADASRVGPLVEALATQEDIQIVGITSAPPRADGWEPTVQQARKAAPHVILVDEVVGGQDTEALTRDLTLQLPASPVVALLSDQEPMDHARRATQAGARSFVTLPLTDGELPRTVREVYALEADRRVAPPPEPAPASPPHAEPMVIAIYSPKGGVGRTTLAANLAVALRMMTHQPVVLVDGSMQLGDLALVLNIESEYGIDDLLYRADELDRSLLEGVLVPHSSGVMVLPAPSRIETVEIMPPEPLLRLLARLREMFDYTIVDTWPILDDGTITVLDNADMILLVTTPELSSLRSARSFLEHSEHLEGRHGRVHVVLNRACSRGGFKLRAIEESLACPVYARIPNDEPLATYSLNRGQPLVISHRRSGLAQGILQLAQLVAAERAPAYGSQNGHDGGLVARLKRMMRVG